MRTTQADLSQVHEALGHEPSVDIPRASPHRRVVPGHRMKVGVIGSGRVGLVTGACLASVGHDVTCMDADAAKVAMLREGRPHFFEPELERLVKEGLAENRLQFTDSVEEAVADAEVVMICVGRPPVGLDDKSLTAVEEAARAIARAASPGRGGRGEVHGAARHERPRGEGDRTERPDLRYSVVSSPEFLREGHAVEDTLEPDRLVVGLAPRRRGRPCRAPQALRAAVGRGRSC